MSTAQLVLNALQPYKIKREGANEYRCSGSPLRPGSNSDGFTLTIDGDEHGAYYDHVTSETGSLYTLAGKLGIQVERAPAAETKRGYKNLGEYAAAHGLTSETLKAAGWSDVQTYQNRPALAFSTATGTRYRFIDGEKPYYKSEKGYKACWYGLKRAITLANETGQPLVICNGEVSTLAAHSQRVAACCVTAGEKEFPNGLVAEFMRAWRGETILAYDCDTTGQQTAQKVRMQLAELNPVIVDLGFTTGGDLADFCILHGDQTREELLKRTIVQPPTETKQTDIELLAAAIDQLRAGLRADAKAAESQDLDALVAKARAELDRVSVSSARPTVISFEEIARDNLALIDFRRENPDPVIGLRSNIPSLDKAIGGFEPEMYVIYGATSMGKSTLAVSFAREFLHQAPGFIATTESNPRRWMIKLVGSICKIPSDKIETGQLTPPEYKQVREAYDWLSSMGCHMLDHGAPTPSALRAAVLTGMEKYGYEWLMVDSGSKMNYPGASSIYDITRGVSNDLQSLWQELNIPLIVTTQVGRDVGERPAGRKMPQIEDGYGGGVIEHNAGVVLGLYNHNYYVEMQTEEPNEELFPKDTALVRILKNRWRGDARISAVRLKFMGGAGFYELKTQTFDLRTL